MGSYDGAEVCELIGIYILSILGHRIVKEDTGLYRDDGLTVLRNTNKQQTDKARKDIIKIFKEIGFNIEIETNMKEVDFLDVTFNLTNGTYRPYKKENDKLMYINTSSNHPRPSSNKYQHQSTADYRIIHRIKKFSMQQNKNMKQRLATADTPHSYHSHRANHQSEIGKEILFGLTHPTTKASRQTLESHF